MILFTHPGIQVYLAYPASRYTGVSCLLIVKSQHISEPQSQCLLLGLLVSHGQNTVFLWGDFRLTTHPNIYHEPKSDSSHSWSSYRPSSLLNTDTEIMTKVLVSKINHFLGQLIHKDYVGFVKLRGVSNNVSWAIQLILFLRASS